MNKLRSCEHPGEAKITASLEVNPVAVSEAVIEALEGDAAGRARILGWPVDSILSIGGRQASFHLN
jgi:hypothetical protein